MSAINHHWRKFKNVLMQALTLACALLVIAPLGFVFYHLIVSGFGSLNWDFFTKLPRSPGEKGGGMANAIVGSFEIILLASLIGLPVGFMAGVYLSEFGGKIFGSLVRYMADLLNGVPSIVIGIFAWTVVVVPMHGFTAIAGAFSLALILIPVTARSTEQFMSSVPQTLREGALALGASKWKTIATVVVPAAYRGIATGMILGVARIAGETAPLLFTSLNNQFWSTNLNAPMASQPVTIFQYALSPYPQWQRLAWAGALIITMAVLLLNIIARTLAARQRTR